MYFQENRELADLAVLARLSPRGIYLMLMRILPIFIIIAGLLFGLPAAADPGKDESGYGYHHERKRHKHKHWHKHRYDREHEADYDDDGHYAYRDQEGPPPWAPAHGYRRKHHHDDGDTVVIVNPPPQEEPAYDDRDVAGVDFRTTSEQIGITSGQCNREVVGTVVGGIVGGVIGNNVTHGKNKNIGTVAGVLIGAIVGNQIGRNMDNADANCTNQALERARDGQVVRWKNPDTGYRYAVTPYKTYQRSDGRYCRDYTAVVTGSKTSKYRETACRSDKGVWEKM